MKAAVRQKALFNKYVIDADTIHNFAGSAVDKFKNADR
jgi:hypothetical protein